MNVPRWVPLWTLILAVAGLLVSGYLTYEHFTGSETLACPDTGVINCQKVTTSPESKFVGIPVALLGLLYFVGMVVACLPALWRDRRPIIHHGRLAGAGLGVLFVLYLIYAELFILDAICLWCTVVHLLTLGLFGLIAFGMAVSSPASPPVSPPVRRP